MSTHQPTTLILLLGLVLLATTVSAQPTEFDELDTFEDATTPQENLEPTGDLWQTVTDPTFGEGVEIAGDGTAFLNDSSTWSYDGDVSYTAQAFIRDTGTNNDAFVMWVGNESPNGPANCQFWCLQYESTFERFLYRHEDQDGNTVLFEADNINYPNSADYSLVLQRDASAKRVVLEIDGEEGFNETYTGTVLGDTAPRIIIGAAAANGGFQCDECIFYETRLWGEKIPLPKLRTIADPDDDTFDQSLQGDEDGVYLFGEGVLRILPPGPGPVDFAQGLEQAVAGFGFQTTESLVFFSIAITGIVLVATAASLKLMSPGRTKNIAITSAALLVGMFFVLVQFIELWVFITSLVVGIFAVAGGPQLARNTYTEIKEELEQLGQPTTVPAVEEDAAGRVVDASAAALAVDQPVDTPPPGEPTLPERPMAEEVPPPPLREAEGTPEPDTGTDTEAEE